MKFFCSLYIFGLIVFNATAQTRNWQWVKTAGGFYSDKATDMDIDTTGKNVFVCGYFNEQANFGTIVSNNGFGKQGFLAKIDSSGNWMWMKEADCGWDERVLGMCVDSVNGYIYVTGCCWGYTGFGSCTFSNFPGGSDEIFVGKFDFSGNCIWLIGAGGDSD